MTLLISILGFIVLFDWLENDWKWTKLIWEETKTILKTLLAG